MLALSPTTRSSLTHTQRIEPFGWDKDDRVYFVLDDNRLYRRSDAPPPANIVPKTPTKSKSNKKSNGRSTRSAKRQRVGRRVIETSPEETEAEHETIGGENEEPEMDDFHMQRWELIAVSMEEYTEFLDTIRKSRDPNEKSLLKSIQEHVMPILLEAEEERKRKEQRRMKELELLQKMASSKRSSRLAGKQEKIQAEREAAEAEARRREELEMAHKEQRRQQYMEEARESRRETREQRLKEREVKRILEQERLEKEQEMLQKIGTDGVVVDADRGRISERQLKADMEKRKQELENLQQDDSWYFDCVCGIHGQNLDDGSHSIACENCSMWQHSKCNGISEQQAERDDFHFVCRDCKKKEENPVKLKLKLGSSPSSKAPKTKTLSEMQVPRAPLPPRANGAAPLVYPGPPPPAPAQNGTRPQSNGNGPTTFQWQAYTPPQPIVYAPPRPAYSPNQNQYAQSPPRQAGAGASPTGYNNYTPSSYAQSHSPPRQPSAYAPPRTSSQPPSTSPSLPQTQHLPRPPQLPRPGSSHHQQPPAQQLPPSQRPPQQMPSNILPPMQSSTQPGSPIKRPVSSGFGPIIPPPLMKSPRTNGTHQPAIERPTSSHASSAPYPAQTVTPAAQRAPIYPFQQPSLSSSQGQTPFNSAPGYSPTKQPSPRIAASPHVPSIASPPVVSPPSTSAAHFSPPKAAASISPLKHASSPPQPPPATLGPAPGLASSSGNAPLLAQPPAPLVNPVQTAPQILPPAPTPP
jgi:hypothetical protein